MMISDPLVGAARRRSELEQALQHLERAAAAPVASATWIDDLTHRLRQLEVALNSHIVEVQTPSGLLDQILDKAPRLQRAVAGIITEHSTLTQGVAEILRVLRAARATPPPVDDIRQAVIDLLGAMTRHRQKGADLVYDAYDVDIGGY